MIADDVSRSIPVATPLLTGVRVLDFGRVIAAPRAARLLADLGADVIHVERPDGGDDTRFDPHYFGHGLSGAFIQENWGKRSLALDLKHPSAREVLEPLVCAADIVIENFRPGVMSRLGLGFDWMSSVNPRIIMCSISGFGQKASSDAGAYGFIADAIAGFPQLTGDADGPPVPSPVPLADVMASGLAFGLICAALHYRETTGRGHYIDLSLMDAALAAHDMALQVHLSTNGSVRPSRRGVNDNIRVPWGYFEGHDGWICLMCGTNRQWKRLLALMGRHGEDLAGLHTIGQRQKAADVVYRTIGDWVRSFDSVDSLLALMGEAGVPSARLNRIEEAATDPRVLSRNLIQTVLHPILGAIKIHNLLGPNSDAASTKPAPLLGQHSREIATEAGLDPNRVSELIEQGCLVVPE